MADKIIQWILMVVIPAIVGYGAAWYHGWRNRRQQRARLLSYLMGLPSECQAVLDTFVARASHTVVLDPGSPPVCILRRAGIISEVSSAGTYDAIAKYFMLRLDVFEILIDKPH